MIKKTLFFILSLSVLSAMPLKVIIIRHGEKDTTNGQLLPKGVTRSNALASYLTELDPTSTNPIVVADGPPSAIFAARPVLVSDDHTIRCIQTVTPTSLKLELPVHSPFGSHQETQLAQHILNDPRYDGKVVLICWHHTLIATLIRAFGYLPPAAIIPYPNRFDLVWLLPFPAPFPPVIVNPVLQELLFNDPTTFP